MHAVLPKSRSFLITRNALSTHSPSSTPIASFHSTPTLCAKRKSKRNSEVRREEKPSKSFFKLVTHQRRTDAKKTLDDFLYNNGYSKFSFEYQEPRLKVNGTGSRDKKPPNHSRRFNKDFFERSAFHHAKRACYRIHKRRGDFSDDDFETDFRAALRKQWKERSNWGYGKYEEWGTSSDSESDDESCIKGSLSDRNVLGLPPYGPLKLDDIKNAFRSSALKWHPDKHHGPSQAVANEKFKQCVDAYKSLCSAFSSA